MARADDKNFSTRNVMTLMAVVLVVAVLYLAQEVLLPIALAVLLSFLLTPPVVALERCGLGRIPAVLLVVATAFAVLGGLGWVVTDQMIDLAVELPKYQETLLTKVRSARGVFGDGSGDLAETFNEIRKELTPEPAAESIPTVRIAEDDRLPLPLRLARVWLAPLLGPLGTAAIVIVFVIFMLIQREDLRDRLIRLAGTGRVYVTTQAFDEAASRVSRYLLMQLIINATYGVAVAVGLWFIDLPNALLWGLFATVFRFIPYIGPWVAALLPISLSIAFFETWTMLLLVVGLFVVLELLSNNVMEPWLYGSSTGISAVGIIVAATFWTWLWGPIGLVLSMPLTVVLVVVGRHVPQLNFLNVLLSDQPALELSVRFYQRLLAFDDHEAGDLVNSFLQTGSLDDLYEKMVLPALSMSERDRNEGHLSARQQRFLHRFVRDLIKDAKEQYDMTAAARAVPEGAAAEAAAADPRVEARQALKVVCLPAEDTADRLAGQIVAQLLAARGHAAVALPVRATGRGVEDLLAGHEAEVVVISAVAPGGAVRARAGCRHLRARLPALRLVVGLWNAGGELSRTRSRLQASGAELVATSLAEALEHLHESARPVKEVNANAIRGT